MSCARVLALCALCIAVAMPAATMAAAARFASPALQVSMTGGGDCNDIDPDVYPGHVEVVGNFVDDDCDGLADEDAANHPSSDIADHDGDLVTIAPDSIFASGFEVLAARER